MPAINTSAVHIDWCPVQRLGEVQRFIDTYWARGHVLARDRELLTWQHRLRGEPDRLAILVADKGDELVAIQGLIPYTFIDLGRRRPATWLTTWQVRPGRDVQGVGLRLLGKALASGFEVAGTVGANAYVMPAYRALRFATWEAVPRHVRVTDAEGLAKLLAAAPENYPPATVDAWCAAARGETAAASPATRVVPFTGDRAARWDRAFEQTLAPTLVGGARDSAHLRWRYLEHPRFRYVVRLSETAGEIDGLSVHRVERIKDRDETLVRVVELLGAPHAALALAADLVATATALGAVMIDYYQIGDVGSAALTAAGFVREDRMPGALPSLFQPFATEPRPLRAALWAASPVTGDAAAYFGRPQLYLTRADCDQDRPNA